MKSLAPQVNVLAAYRDGATVQVGPSCSIGQGLYRTLYNLRDDAACYPPSLIVSYRIVYADNGAVLGGRYDPAVYTRHTCLDCLEDKARFFSSPTGRAIMGILGAVDTLRTSALYLRLRIARRIAPLAVAGVTGDLASFPAPGIECYRTDSGKWDYRRIPEEVR